MLVIVLVLGSFSIVYRRCWCCCLSNGGALSFSFFDRDASLAAPSLTSLYLSLVSALFADEAEEAIGKAHVRAT